MCAILEKYGLRAKKYRRPNMAGTIQQIAELAEYHGEPWTGLSITGEE